MGGVGGESSPWLRHFFVNVIRHHDCEIQLIKITFESFKLFHKLNRRSSWMGTGHKLCLYNLLKMD